MSESIGLVVIVQCDDCGKQGDDHEIPNISLPDGTSKNLCDNCFKRMSEEAEKARVWLQGQKLVKFKFNNEAYIKNKEIMENEEVEEEGKNT